MKRPLPLLAFLAAVVGCTEGQLSQSAVEQPCAAGDAQCEAKGASAPIAAGALFALQFRPIVVGGTTAAVSLRTVDPGVAAVENFKLRAVEPGITAVISVLEDGTAVDFTHVTVVKANRMTLHRGGGVERDERELPETIQVFPNEELSLSLRVWRDGQELAGDVEDAWGTSDPAFLIVNQGFPQERRVRMPDAGEADLTINAVGITHTLHLEVVQ